MKWSLHNKDATRPGRRIVVAALAAAGLMLPGSIAGLHAANMGVPAPANRVEAARLLGTAAPNQISGVLQTIDRSTLTIITRNGASVLIDDAEAFHEYRASPLDIGKAFTFGGAFDSRGKLRATVILRAKDSTAAWPTDR
jgi:hypothetical protein